MKSYRYGAGFLTILISCAFYGCGADSQPDVSKPRNRDIQLKLNWFPEAEHGGFYAALVHGYYRDAGLNVEILPGGPKEPVLQNVASGRVDFGISNADQLLIGRARKADVVGLFAALQTSPRCVMVHRKSGIDDFEELQGLTLAINENSSFGSYLRRHVELKDCQIVPYPGNVTQFLLNEDFAQQAYVFSEPFVDRKEGGDPHHLMAAEIGFNPYTSVLVASQKFIDGNPELVRKFVTATRKGWQKYLADPDETNAYIHQQNPEMDLDILAFGASELKQLCTADGVTMEQLGAMTTQRWSLMTAQLVECEVIGIDDLPLDAAGAFTTEFLQPASSTSEDSRNPVAPGKQNTEQAGSAAGP